MTGTELFDRLPPRDIEAERAVIGAVLTDSTVLGEVDDLIGAGAFFREAHGWTYEACRELWLRDEPVTPVSVSHELARRDRLEAIGGVTYLSELVMSAPPTVGVRYYAELIRQQHIAREVIRVAHAISEHAYRDPDGINESAPRLITEMVDALRGSDTEQARLLSEIIDADFLRRLTEWCERPATLEGIPTGIPTLDHLIGGLRTSGFHLIAGATSVGKSLFGQFLALELARRDYRVVFFTTEMDYEEVANRLLQQSSGVNRMAGRLRGSVSDDDARALKEGAYAVRRLPIRVRPGSLNLDRLITDVKRLRHAWPFDVVIVDHLHMVYVPELRRDRVLELERVTSGMKNLAEDEHLPVIGLAHMNRGGQAAHAGKVSERRWSRQTDMHGASALERDANVVILMDPARLGTSADGEDAIGRYVPMADDEIDALPWDQRDITVRLRVAKVRDGMRGTFWMQQRWSQGGRWYELDMTHGDYE